MSAPDQLVTLVHGLGSSRLLMRCLELRLRQHGFATHNWGYPSFRGSIADHARRLRQRLDELAAETGVLHLVGHSMGAIITRVALADGGLAQLGRVVLLAPPNRGTPLARRWSRLLRPICPALRELSDHPHSLVNQIVTPPGVEFGVIAASYDLLVPLPSTMLAEQADHITLKATHGSLLFQAAATQQIKNFLTSGRFESGSAKVVTQQ